MVKRLKDRLRKEILARRKAQSEPEIRDKSRKIGQTLFNLEEFKRATVVAFYVSFGSEVRTRDLVEESLKIGKQVAVPFCKVDQVDLGLSLIQNFQEDLEPGAFGILEPKKGKRAEFPLSEVDLMTIPGIVFDLAGHRLGYGQGFYDKFLNQMSKAILIGMGFELQIVERLPKMPHDISVEKIITENRVIIASNSGDHADAK
ncbi:MAG TPA: 5-formyltetrahydrofolate cyclo-ligase [Candidatus Subteraquimicrobiales bacterium]